jgi:hypothetical protein
MRNCPSCHEKGEIGTKLRASDPIARLLCKSPFMAAYASALARCHNDARCAPLKSHALAAQRPCPPPTPHAPAKAARLWGETLTTTVNQGLTGLAPTPTGPMRPGSPSNLAVPPDPPPPPTAVARRALTRAASSSATLCCSNSIVSAVVTQPEQAKQSASVTFTASPALGGGAPRRRGPAGSTKCGPAD